MVRRREFLVIRKFIYLLINSLGFDQASSNVQWMVIRNNSSFLRKRKLGTFTTVC